MSLSYKNLGKTQILENHRNIKYCNGELLYGFNSLDLNIYLDADIVQISNQGDVWSRSIMTHRSLFDFKRILGSYTEDWERLLHEAYVYDRAKCIYYAKNIHKIHSLPDNLVSFPGNLLLVELMGASTYSFNTNDVQPFSLTVRASYFEGETSLLDKIFEYYPDIKQGMSENDNIISFVNTKYEAIMRGLYNAMKFLETKKESKGKEPLFQVVEMSSNDLKPFTKEDNNPLFNSFMGKDTNRKTFYYIMPATESSANCMRFNESLYFGRAIGFIGDQLQIDGNNMFSSAKRIEQGDFLTREDVFAITGLRTEIVPYSQNQINQYMNINSYIREGENKNTYNFQNLSSGGSVNNTP